MGENSGVSFGGGLIGGLFFTQSTTEFNQNSRRGSYRKTHLGRESWPVISPCKVKGRAVDYSKGGQGPEGSRERKRGGREQILICLWKKSSLIYRGGGSEK